MGIKGNIKLLSIILIISITIGFLSTLSLYFSILMIFTILFLLISFNYIKWYKQKEIVYCILIFLPFYAFIRAIALYLNIGVMATLINYLRDFLILYSLLLLILNHIYQGKNNKISINIFDKAVLLLLFNYLIGFLLSIVWGNTVLGLKGLHLSVFPILLYFITRSIRIDQKFVGNCYKIITITGTIVACSGVYFYFSQPLFFGNLLKVFRSTDEDINTLVSYARMVGIYLSPNVFGTFMAINVVVLSIFLLYKRSLINVLCLVLCIIGLIFSLSRGSWMFAFSGIIIALIYNFKFAYMKKNIILFSIGLLGISLVVLNSFKSITGILLGRLQSLFSFENESSYGRVDNWLLYLEKLKEHPEGYGLGVGSQAMTGNLKVIMETGINVIDGYYIKLLIETGFVGFGLFSFSIIIIIWKLINLKVTEEWKNIHICITLSLFIGMLVQQFGSNILDFVAISPYFWILLGVCANEQILGRSLKNIRK